jgi:hypothetical protein
MAIEGAQTVGTLDNASALEGMLGSSGLTHQPDHEIQLLFCYSLVRSPVTETGKLLGWQLAKACDGWALFSSENDSSLNIVQGYTRAEETVALKHQMHEMVIAGAWKHMVEMRVPERYKWILKVDEDTYVRPSTLRSVFTKYAQLKKIMSVSDANDNQEASGLEGFFLATPAALMEELYTFGKTQRDCDVLASGHDEDWWFNKNKFSSISCDAKFGSVEAVLDAYGLPVVASDGEGIGHACGDLAFNMLQFSRSTDPGGVFCDCKFYGKNGPACLSKEFAAIHPVRSGAVFEQLAKAFP